MIPSSPTGGPPPSKFSISRRTAVKLGLVVWLFAIPLFHGGLPYLLAGLDIKHGWIADWPGTLNWLGLLPILCGAALLCWVMVTGFSKVRDLPERITVGWKPVCFIPAGPFAISRNPMYFSYVMIWHGWAVFFGSFPVLAMTLLIWGSLKFVIIPHEERDLEKTFGATYLAYKSEVSRWFGRTSA